MAILFRKNSIYNWDRVWLSELEILHYHEDAESQAKRINETISSVWFRDSVSEKDIEFCKWIKQAPWLRGIYEN
jgi:hypothetical protein